MHGEPFRSKKRPPYSILHLMLILGRRQFGVQPFIEQKKYISEAILITMAGTVSLNDSIRKVSKNIWLIANTLLLTHYASPVNIPTNHTCWSESNGTHFALSPAPKPLPDSKPLAEGSSPISRVHAVDNQAAVWRAGEALIKAHHIDYPDVTREHVTLQFLKDQEPQWFEFPNVLHHFETDSRYFLIVSRIPGQRLHEAWPSMELGIREEQAGSDPRQAM